jgi:hypothetical protein
MSDRSSASGIELINPVVTGHPQAIVVCHGRQESPGKTKWRGASSDTARDLHWDRRAENSFLIAVAAANASDRWTAVKRDASRLIACARSCSLGRALTKPKASETYSSVMKRAIILRTS